MNNELVSKSFLTRLKGVYQAKYGIEMDEWSAMVLYEISENFEENNKVAESTIKEIEKASNLIKGQIEPIHFHRQGDAFWHGIGRSFPLALAIFFTGLLFYYLMRNTTDYQDKKAFIEKHPNFELFDIIMKKGIFQEYKGVHYLILTPTDNRDSLVVGREFIYDKDQNAAFIPLDKKE
jgi:hypothetical protein